MHALFDIGGTKTRVAITRDLVHIDESIVWATSSIYRDGVGAIITEIQKLQGSETLVSCAGGIRGPLTADRSGIAYDSVLTDWQKQPLVSDLSRGLGVPVLLENDAALAGLGEAHVGAGKGFPIVAYLTVSTGVGGTRIVNGKIDAQSVGFEPGHQVISVEHIDCPTCDIGVTLEEQISGTALEARFHKKPRDIPQEDPIWAELAGHLAYGIQNLIAFWSPDVIVLGGSMIVGSPRILLSDITAHTKRILSPSLQCPPIKDALLGDSGGLYGAMVQISQV